MFWWTECFWQPLCEVIDPFLLKLDPGAWYQQLGACLMWTFINSGGLQAQCPVFKSTIFILQYFCWGTSVLHVCYPHVSCKWCSCFCSTDMSWLSCSCCQFDLAPLSLMFCQQTPFLFHMRLLHTAVPKFFDWSFEYWNHLFICTFPQISLYLFRIQSLSDALGDLYRQFNSLKDELGRLTTKFDRVEAFVDELKDGSYALPQQPVRRIPPGVGLRSPLRAQMRSPNRGIIIGPPPIRVRRRRTQRP